MKRPHNLISIVFALLTLVVIQLFATPFPIFRFLFPAYFGLIGLFSWYNHWYLKKIGKYNHWLLLRNVLVYLAIFAFLLILPNPFTRGLFLILATVIIAFFEFFIGHFSETIMLNETLIMAFGFSISFCAYGWYFPKSETLLIMATLVVTFLMARSAYEFIPQPEKTKNISAAVLALFCSEIFWVLSFLPFHYSAIGLMLFSVFYFCFILNYYYLINTLNFKKFQLHLTLFVFAILLIIFITPWRILN